MKKRGITAHKFTQAEGTEASPKFGGISEREYLIQQFAAGKYQVLVAIKCLDEGIDIPSAHTGIRTPLNSKLGFIQATAIQRACSRYRPPTCSASS